MKGKRILTSVNVQHVALCQRGMNPNADITLAKGKKEMTVEDILESLKPEEAAVIEKALQKEPAEDVLKSADPRIIEMLKAQEQQIAELTKAQTEVLAEKRYELCKAIPVEEAVLKEVLKSVSPSAFEVLKAASAAITETVLKKAVGTDAAGERVAESAYTSLEKAAKEIQVAKSITFEKAFDLACMTHADLYAAYEKEVN